ncbi:hypothetical protein LTR53_013887, partial [Teratosphaeriaceae sp. CCFEE 6253]
MFHSRNERFPPRVDQCTPPKLPPSTGRNQGQRQVVIAGIISSLPQPTRGANTVQKSSRRSADEAAAAADEMNADRAPAAASHARFLRRFRARAGPIRSMHVSHRGRVGKSFVDSSISGTSKRRIAQAGTWA